MTTTVDRPAESLDSFIGKPATKQRGKKKRTSRRRKGRIPGLYYPVDMTPEQLFKELGKLRRKAGDEIERLISLLDRIDADPDLEPSSGYLPPGILDESEPDADDEPILGSSPSDYQPAWARGTRDDREDEHDGSEPDGDDENSMGWQDVGCQSLLGGGGMAYQGEDEPALGSFDRMVDQTKSWQQHSGPSAAWAGVDAELDNADREPSLGSLSSTCPIDMPILGESNWAGGSRDDREVDAGDCGECQ